MLAVGGMREALRAASAPVVAVSPFVGGQVVKGPTEPFLHWAGVSTDASGVAAYYGGLLDGLVCDEEGVDAPVPSLVTATLMDSASERERLARETLDFARALA